MLYNTPKNFGMRCQRFDKNEDEVKILLMQGGRSFAFTLPFMGKVYIDPAVTSANPVSIKQTPCSLVEEKAKNSRYALPATRYTQREEGKEIEDKVRVDCKIQQTLPVSDEAHSHTLPANSLIYFQADEKGDPSVVLIKKVNLEDLHTMSVRSNISNIPIVRISWRIGQDTAAQGSGDFLPLPKDFKAV